MQWWATTNRIWLALAGAAGLGMLLVLRSGVDDDRGCRR
jgi:hypothetical protein